MNTAQPRKKVKTTNSCFESLKTDCLEQEDYNKRK